jgi:hypothetical protein
MGYYTLKLKYVKLEQRKFIKTLDSIFTRW